jgi:hypothetical protein
MCEKCAELDSKIAHYGLLASSVRDARAVDGINQLIEKMKVEKAALHPLADDRRLGEDIG